jgi:hypothetical protein
MVTFWVGVAGFLGAAPASKDANASPPAFLGADPPIFPPGDMTDGVEAPD